MQKVREIFSDYKNVEEAIFDIVFLNANLYKKSNRLEVSLLSDRKISIGEISNFEEYISNRFKVGSARIDINYEDFEIDFSLEEDWSRLIEYISKKEPMTKALLADSVVAVVNNNVCVKLKKNGADFLKSKRFDKALERLLKNLYNKECKVVFEQVDQMSKEEYEKHLKEQERQAIMLMQETAKKEAEQRDKNNAEGSVSDEIKKENQEVSSKLVFGKTVNFKSKSAKITDINDSTTKVNVEGEVIDITSRDIKNNRSIVSFSVDDGNGSIVCKAFVDTDLTNGILSDLKEGQGVIVDGTAKYDDYQNEIVLMANNVVLSDYKNSSKEEIASENKEGGEVSPLIYGRSLSIKTPKVKIVDINNDTDRVCVEGEVISFDSRDIKGDRTIVMFNVYDGSSTMTMKAFVDGKKAKEVLGRLKKAKGVMVDGVAKYDNFAKEITVMANTILETMR